MTGMDGVSGKNTTPAWPKAIVLGSLLVLMWWAGQPGQAQAPVRGETVADVVIHGNRAIATEKIKTYIRTRPGMPYREGQVQEDINRLTESGLFRHVAARDERTSDGRVLVHFHVTEYAQTVQEIIYKNAGHLSEKELDNMTGLRKGMPLNPALNRKACYEITDHYRRKGRYFASVKLEEGDKIGDTRVVFNITEGPIVRVHKTFFTGNKELAWSDRLRTQIDTSRAFLGLMGGVYNPAMVDSDVLKLEEYYKANGFLDVRVTREQKFSDDFRSVDLTFHIHEGQRYRVKDVQVDQTRYLDRHQVSSVVQLNKGDYYNDGVVTADMRNITDLYGWRGYPVVVQKELFFPEPGLVQVQYEVKERPPSLVGQVHIVGNEVTKDRVIRRVLGLKPGQTLCYPEVRVAERDLLRLNIFENNQETGVRPTVLVLDNDDSPYKDILVQVKETHTGSLMFGAGFNSDAGLVGSIVLNERNFDIFRFPTSIADILEGRAWRGAGQEFRIEAVPGTQLQRYTVSFREPFLLDLAYSLSTSGFYYDRVFQEYRENRVGGRFTVGHQLTRAWSINGGMRLENIGVSNVPFWAPADYTSVVGHTLLAAPRVGVTWDTRDSFLRPTEGAIVEAAFEQALGDFTFPIISLEGSKYFTMWQRTDGSGRHVLAARSAVYWAGSDVPVMERFYAGGIRSLRGFRFRGVGPRDAGFNVGGDFMFLNSLEYQVPIRANDQLYAVAFLDSGTVERSVEIKDYRVSVGVGLRIAVPMLGPVPIALDFGFPIVTGPGDERQMFNFWVGMFR